MIRTGQQHIDSIRHGREVRTIGNKLPFVAIASSGLCGHLARARLLALAKPAQEALRVGRCHWAGNMNPLGLITLR